MEKNNYKMKRKLEIKRGNKQTNNIIDKNKILNKYIMAKIEEYDIETEDGKSVCLIDPIWLGMIILLILFIIYIMSFREVENKKIV